MLLFLKKVKENSNQLLITCEFILCTGLFDEDDPDINKSQLHENDLDYYKNFLIKSYFKKISVY